MEELKKKFIVNDNLEEETIKNYVERLLPFCKLSSNGNILVDKKISTSLKRMKTALVGRFLANRLEPSIPAEMSGEELSTILNIPKDQIYARVKDLKKERFVVILEKKKYRVQSHEIDKFLSELEKEFGTEKK
ncbi:MAG: hypothetical protein ABSC20_10195 [Candidatus Bathyarchaeia archaeon]|jgi:hypothetical protein